MTEENKNNEQQYSLNDDRRVKVLSPGALVRRRFLRNRIAVFGLAVLVLMFLFSFVGGAISPYKEDQLFYRTDMHSKQFAAVVENKEYQYTANDPRFTSIRISCRHMASEIPSASALIRSLSNSSASIDRCSVFRIR